MSAVPPSDRGYDTAAPAAGWRDPAAGTGWSDEPAVAPPRPPVAAPPGVAHPGVAPTPPPHPGLSHPGVANPVGGASSPGGWAQPPTPGYADPRLVDPAYQPTTAWPSGPEPAAGYRPARPRRTGPSWLTIAPALVGSVAISVAVVGIFLGNLFVALGAPRGTAGRDRLLQFLAPADLAAAAALLLAVALVVLQRQLPAGAPVVGPRGGRVRSVALLAGVVGAVVATGALLRAVVLLTVPHTPGAVKIGDFIAQLAIVLVAGAASAWALRQRW